MSQKEPSSSPPSAPAPSSSPASAAPVPLEVDVGPDSESHFFVDLSGDASPAGIVVATWRDIPVGTAVTIASKLPDGPIVVAGRVRWVRDARCETGPGIGVALDHLEVGDTARIARFCETCPPYFYDVEAA
jgi:hypothetical protein